MLEILVSVLDPHDRHVLAPCRLDEDPDVGHDRVAIMAVSDHAVLDVDDEERGVRAVSECGQD